MKFISRPMPALLPALLIIALTWACVQEPETASSSFQVLSLAATPARTMAGEETTVSAQVTNTGGLPGNFSGQLTLNGQPSGSKTVTIMPGKTASISFKVTKDQPGVYKVQLAEATATITVIEVKEQQVELKYDTGTSQDALWAGNNGGFLIDFTPANPPLYLNKIRICAGLYGVAWEGKLFDLYVLDAYYTPLYSRTYAVAKIPVEGAFPYRPPEWVDFDITPLNITDKFFVYLYTNMNRHKGIHVGVDDSVTNEHSILASGKPPNLAITTMENFYPAGSWYRDTSKVNWMIRASGTARVPVE